LTIGWIFRDSIFIIILISILLVAFYRTRFSIKFKCPHRDRYRDRDRDQKNDLFFGSFRQYKPQWNQTFGLGGHAANGAFYSFDPDSDPDPDYHSTTDIDSLFGYYLSFIDNRIIVIE
jgi:hypothetical protein